METIEKSKTYGYNFIEAFAINNGYEKNIS